MQKAKLWFLFSLFTMSLIFFLYIKDYMLKGLVYIPHEEIVFYEDDGYLKGSYLEVKNEIEDIFSYLTDDKNYAPINHISNISETLKLLNYNDLDNKLVLYLDNDFKNYKKEIPLLFESYHLLGYDYLDIYTKNNYYSFDEKAIFDLGTYKNYQDQEKSGNITYLYQLGYDFVNFSVSFEEDNIVFLLDKLELDYMNEDFLIIFYENLEDLTLIELNFKKIRYKVQKK